MAANQLEIPKRALFKAAEVCEIAQVQPYVLRTWEVEFPDLGVAKATGGPRYYRRSDVERVLRIKDLLFAEGLTLAGVRRRLGQEPSAADAATPPIEELLGRDVRERLGRVKAGLQSILGLLSENGEPGRHVASKLTRPHTGTPTSRKTRPSAAGAHQQAKGSAKRKRASA